MGSLLRRRHVDELPQLWNVLKGDLRLIGPRPGRQEISRELIKAVPRYRLHLLVRPGITGLGQVQLPPDTNVDSVRSKLPYDLYYVCHSNPWLDFRIYLATALHLLSTPAPLRRGLLLLPHGDEPDREAELPGPGGVEFGMM
jgi:lipopolysaccharide/colanic/teichoic acid biosynthesis glycosyltransferase